MFAYCFFQLLINSFSMFLKVDVKVPWRGCESIASHEIVCVVFMALFKFATILPVGGLVNFCYRLAQHLSEENDNCNNQRKKKSSWHRVLFLHITMLLFPVLLIYFFNAASITHHLNALETNNSILQSQKTAVYLYVTTIVVLICVGMDGDAIRIWISTIFQVLLSFFK